MNKICVIVYKYVNTNYVNYFTHMYEDNSTVKNSLIIISLCEFKGIYLNDIFLKYW